MSEQVHILETRSEAVQRLLARILVGEGVIEEVELRGIELLAVADAYANSLEACPGPKPYETS